MQQKTLFNAAEVKAYSAARALERLKAGVSPHFIHSKAGELARAVAESTSATGLLAHGNI